MAVSTRLPIPPNRLVGRAELVLEIEDLVCTARLVTLTGTGGTGKTRLAIEIASRLLSRFDGRVAFVSLGSVSDGGLLPTTIATQLGLKGVADVPTLASAIGSEHMLVVLDNFEHLLDAAPAVAELLATCPELHVLVTSRSPLRLAAEREYAIPPLRLPAAASTADDFASIAGYEAVELFLERARAVNPAFVSRDARVVAEICTRLDGLPLALELAAARTKLLSPPALLARLEQRLPFLVSAPRDAPARHQTLRATIDWSYDLLDDAEKAVFARLAVFSGGFALDSVEAVCKTRGVGLEAVDAVASLFDKSLVNRVAPPGDADRFTLLNTIHEYALERLVERGEEDACRRRHAELFLALAEGSDGRDDKFDREERLDADLDNFRAALDWFATAGRHEDELRLAIALARFWRVRGYLAEGWTRLAHALSTPAGTPEMRANALGAAAGFAFFQGRYADAKPLVEEGLTLSRALGNGVLEGRFLTELATVLAAEGKLERADDLLERSMTMFEQAGERAFVAASMHNRGLLRLRAGQLDHGERLCADALELFRALDDDQGIALALQGLGVAALERGEPALALSRFRESLPLAERHRFLIGVAAGLEGIAAALAALADARPASLLLGAADTLRQSVGAQPEPLERAVRDRALRDVDALLGDRSVAALRSEGRRLELAEAIACALEEAEAPTRRVARTFLFTDIVRSTPLLRAIGDEAWARLLAWHDRTLRRLFARYGGEEVDHQGDGFFVAFENPAEALDCAVAIQRELEEHRREKGFAPEVRIGVHTAAALRVGSAYRGKGVHEAARLAALAEPGQVVASGATVEVVPRITAADRRVATLRGSDQPVEVVSVDWR